MAVRHKSDKSAGNTVHEHTVNMPVHATSRKAGERATSGQ
jgi:hypothetical protein